MVKPEIKFVWPKGQTAELYSDPVKGQVEEAVKRTVGHSPTESCSVLCR